MFYTFFLLIFFTFILFFRKPDNKEYIWIIISIVGFCMAILAFAFYIFNLYEYYKIKTVYFDYSDYIWIFINMIKLDPYTVNRLLNFGIVTFIFSLINFSYLYTHSNRREKIISYKYCVIPILFLIFYDPSVLRLIFYIAVDFKRTYFNFSFTSIMRIFNWINRLWMSYYICVSFYWLYKDYTQHIIKKIKKKIVYIMLCLIPISGLFMMMFYWFPQQIIILREKNIYKNYDSDFTFSEFSYRNFIHLPVLYKLYPIITILSIFIFIYAIYSLRVFNLFEKMRYSKLDYSFNTAGLGIKVISHSVKSDLYAIKLLVQDCLNRKQHEMELGKIVKICDSNLEMFDKLKKTTNVKVENVVPVNIVQCISQVTEKIDIPGHITLTTSFQESVMEAYLDENYFCEVINSIIQNSIDAINTKRCKGLVNISCKKLNKEFIISIKDNGCGIDPERVNMVFDPFFSTKPSAKNWGMGLSYCNMVIQAFNGEIHFSTVQGQESEVLINLPLV